MHPIRERAKTTEKGKSGSGLILKVLSAILPSVTRERARGITPLPSLQHSSPYNQATNLPPDSSPNIPYTTHRLIPLSFIRPVTRFLVSMLSTMFSIPFIYKIPPNCATPSVPPPEDSSTLSPPLSPYLQSYIKRAPTTPSTPSIHYPYAYSLNTFLIVLLSYSLFIPPNCPTL